MQSILSTIRVWYGRCAFVLSYFESPLLLAIRLYWGWQFMQDGLGKLTHLSNVTEYFTTLGLPAPAATAFMVGSVELVGGFLFTFGIASRLVSLVLFVNMTVAYLAAPDDRVNLSHIFSKPEDFYSASPYTYWFAALLIMILGPGAFALDWFFKRNRAENGPAHVSDSKPTLIR